MDKAQRAEYDRAYREKAGAARKALQAKWRLDNAAHLKARATARRLAKRAMCLVAAARVRARQRGIAFSVTDEDVAHLQRLIDVGVCEVTGVSLTLNGQRSATSPSLDRIHPALGYVSGNLRIVCHAVNAGMGDWGEAELFRIAAAWVAKENGNAINAQQAAVFIHAVTGGA